MKKIIQIALIITTALILSSCKKNGYIELELMIDVKLLSEQLIIFEDIEKIRFEIEGNQEKIGVFKIPYIQVNNELKFKESKLPKEEDKYFSGNMKIPTNEKSVKTKIKNGSAHSGFHISNRNYEEAFLEINMKKYSTIIFAMDLSDLHETKAYITIVRRTYY